MTRNSGRAHSAALMVAAAVAAVSLAGCSNAPQPAPLADLPQPPTAIPREGVEAASITSSSTPTVRPAEASAPRAPQVQPKQTVTAREPDSAIVGSPWPTHKPASSGTKETTPSRPSADELEPEPVGPAVSYEDAADDATGGAEAPVGQLSQPPLDLLHVAWTPVAYDERHRRGYSTSITIAGSAREDAAYVAWGSFFADGETCQLYNILELGRPAYAHAFCGFVEDGSRRFLGRMTGREVTSISTTAGGTTLVGTFDDLSLPSALESAGRTLYDLAAFTAVCSPTTDECGTYAQEWDWVSSSTSFRL